MDKKILEMLADGKALTAQEIATELRKGKKRIGLSAVKGTLSELVERGQVISRFRNAETRYLSPKHAESSRQTSTAE